MRHAAARRLPSSGSSTELLPLFNRMAAGACFLSLPSALDDALHKSGGGERFGRSFASMDELLIAVRSENTAATAAFLTENGVSELNLLLYNPLWEAKVPRLGIGIDHPPLGIRPPDEAFYTTLQSAFERRGLVAHM